MVTWIRAKLSQWARDRQQRAHLRLVQLGGAYLIPPEAPFDDDEDEGESATDESEEENAERAGSTRNRAARRDRTYFGPELWGTSAHQRAAIFDEAKILRFGLPALRTEQDVAAWLGISVTRLRWFTRDRAAETTWHYVSYARPKRRGGVRTILAPKRELKALQRKVLDDLVGLLPVSPAAHGFVKGRSIASNARPHVGKRVVIGLDLKDFFPTITFQRVRGTFVAFGYSFSVASTLALLCTEYHREPFERGEKHFYISVGPRHLVQGAPTSPGLANLVAWRLDRRLMGLAARYGCAYTRYADDLTFSCENPAAIGGLLTSTRKIITDEHFTVNSAKTRVLRRAKRQIVTGLVVNDALGTPRQLRRRIRAMLHHARHGTLTIPLPTVQGLIAYVHSVNPKHAEPLLAALRALQSADGNASET